MTPRSLQPADDTHLAEPCLMGSPSATNPSGPITTGQKSPRPRSSPEPPPPIEPLMDIEGWARVLNCSRRAVERLKSAGKLPPPDLKVGKMPRWKPETARRWIDSQATSRGGRA